jgi:hypothetical protein
VASVLESSGRLRNGITTDMALGVLWAMTAPDCYAKFVSNASGALSVSRNLLSFN